MSGSQQAGFPAPRVLRVDKFELEVGLGHTNKVSENTRAAHLGLLLGRVDPLIIDLVQGLGFSG